MFHKAIRTNLDKLKNDIASLEAQLFTLDQKKGCVCPPTRFDRNKGSGKHQDFQTAPRKGLTKLKCSSMPHNNHPGTQTDRTQVSGTEERFLTTPRKSDCPCKKAAATERFHGSAREKSLANTPRKTTCPCKVKSKTAEKEECCECDCPSKLKKPPFYLGTINPVQQNLPKTKNVGTLTSDRQARRGNAPSAPCKDCGDCPFGGSNEEKTAHCPCGKLKSDSTKHSGRKQTEPCDDCKDCPFAQKGDKCLCADKAAGRSKPTRNDGNIMLTLHKDSRCPCSKNDITVKTMVKTDPCGDCPFTQQVHGHHGRLDGDCEAVDHYHHRICIPLDIQHTPKKKERLKVKDKPEDGNSTWREILTKKQDSKKAKDPGCKCSSKQKEIGKASRPKVSDKSKDNEKLLTKELEVKNLAIRNMEQMLEKHEKGEAILTALVTNLQEELDQAQEGQGKAKLETLLKALEEEKLKVLLAGKDVVLDHVIRCNEALEERLGKQREFDRNVAATLEVEKILMSLRPQMADLTASSANGSQIKRSDGRPPQTSTPTGSAESLDGFAIESWDEISRIAHSRI